MSEDAYSPLFDEAVRFALEKFRPVFRKGSRIPYMTHLMAVCALVGQHGGSEEQMIAALLHDYLEDIPGARREDLASRFGDRVADWVVALSDTTIRPKPPWLQRKQAYLVTLRDKPPEVRLISTADKLHNCTAILRGLRQLGPAVFERFKGKRDGTLWYYWSVVQALGDGWEHPLLDELTETARALHELAQEPWGPPYDVAGL